jgi:hypothetical protein
VVWIPERQRSCCRQEDYKTSRWQRDWYIWGLPSVAAVFSTTMNLRVPRNRETSCPAEYQVFVGLAANNFVCILYLSLDKTKGSTLLPPLRTTVTLARPSAVPNTYTRYHRAACAIPVTHGSITPGSGTIAPRILNLDTRWWENPMICVLYPL